MLLFDVFGTDVDWRGSIIRAGQQLTRQPRRRPPRRAPHRLRAPPLEWGAAGFSPDPAADGFDLFAGDLNDLAARLVG